MARYSKVATASSPPVRFAKSLKYDQRAPTAPSTLTSTKGSPTSANPSLQSNVTPPRRLRSSRLTHDMRNSAGYPGESHTLTSPSASFGGSSRISPNVKDDGMTDLENTALDSAKDPLYAAGAFTIATALVGLSLFISVWCTKMAMGVESVRSVLFHHHLAFHV